MPSALAIDGLSKTYADGSSAVRDLSLEVADGAFVGLLGPNGAGKTTLIGSVCNIVRPTAGTISVFGHAHHSREARRLVGLAEQDVTLDRFISAEQMLIYQAGYYGIGRAEARRRARDLLDRFALASKARSRSGALSGGMQRRLLLARALVHGPRLLILDEPTAGADVELRHELWEYIRALHGAGVTVVLTTHYLEEAEELCDEIALIRRGSLVARGTAADLRECFGARNISELYLRAVGEAA